MVLGGLIKTELGQPGAKQKSRTLPVPSLSAAEKRAIKKSEREYLEKLRKEQEEKEYQGNGRMKFELPRSRKVLFHLGNPDEMRKRIDKFVKDNDSSSARAERFRLKHMD
jgi:hypothetical protein